MRNIIVRAVVAAFLLLAIAMFAIDWNELVLSGARRNTDDATLQGDPVTLQTRVTGYLASVPAVDYQLVHRGDLLFQIEDTDYRARVARAEADFAQADAAVRVADAQVAQGQAQLGVAVAAIHSADAGLVQSRQELARQSDLLHTESFLQRDYQNAQASEQSQQAAKDGRLKDLAAAEAQMDVLRAQASQARATRFARQAALDLARIELGYTRITAPVDGVLTTRLLRRGAFAAAGSSLITIVPLTPVWVVANYREVALTHVLPGQEVRIHVDALPNAVLHGHVDSLGPQSQADLSALPPDRAAGNFTKITQRVPVKIDLDPRPELEGALRPGLSAETWIDTAR